MNKIMPSNQAKSKDKKDLINFVAEQFKQLTKKKLRVPIQLYHL